MKKRKIVFRIIDIVLSVVLCICTAFLYQNFIFNIEQGLMKNTHLTEWKKWSEHKQDQLISLAGHLAKGMEEAELTDEEWLALAKSMEEPIENINPVVEKKPKKKSKK